MRKNTLSKTPKTSDLGYEETSEMQEYLHDKITGYAEVLMQSLEKPKDFRWAVVDLKGHYLDWGTQKIPSQQDLFSA